MRKGISLRGGGGKWLYKWTPLIAPTSINKEYHKFVIDLN
jgi:hypothetical protein